MRRQNWSTNSGPVLRRKGLEHLLRCQPVDGGVTRLVRHHGNSLLLGLVHLRMVSQHELLLGSARDSREELERVVDGLVHVEVLVVGQST